MNFLYLLFSLLIIFKGYCSDLSVPFAPEEYKLFMNGYKSMNVKVCDSDIHNLKDLSKSIDEYTAEMERFKEIYTIPSTINIYSIDRMQAKLAPIVSKITRDITKASLVFSNFEGWRDKISYEFELRDQLKTLLNEQKFKEMHEAPFSMLAYLQAACKNTLEQSYQANTYVDNNPDLMIPKPTINLYNAQQMFQDEPNFEPDKNEDPQINAPKKNLLSSSQEYTTEHWTFAPNAHAFEALFTKLRMNLESFNRNVKSLEEKLENSAKKEKKNIKKSMADINVDISAINTVITKLQRINQIKYKDDKAVLPTEIIENNIWYEANLEKKGQVKIGGNGYPYVINLLYLAKVNYYDELLDLCNTILKPNDAHPTVHTITASPEIVARRVESENDYNHFQHNSLGQIKEEREIFRDDDTWTVYKQDHHIVAMYWTHLKKQIEEFDENANKLKLELEMYESLPEEVTNERIARIRKVKKNLDGNIHNINTTVKKLIDFKSIKFKNKKRYKERRIKLIDIWFFKNGKRTIKKDVHDVFFVTKLLEEMKADYYYNDFAELCELVINADKDSEALISTMSVNDCSQKIVITRSNIQSLPLEKQDTSSIESSQTNNSEDDKYCYNNETPHSKNVELFGDQNSPIENQDTSAIESEMSESEENQDIEYNKQCESLFMDCDQVEKLVPQDTDKINDDQKLNPDIRQITVEQNAANISQLKKNNDIKLEGSGTVLNSDNFSAVALQTEQLNASTSSDKFEDDGKLNDQMNPGLLKNPSNDSDVPPTENSLSANSANNDAQDNYSLSASKNAVNSGKDNPTLQNNEGKKEFSNLPILQKLTKNSPENKNPKSSWNRLCQFIMNHKRKFMGLTILSLISVYAWVKRAALTRMFFKTAQ